jgi:uncharacterized protein YebE (UPF0316 family)
MIRILITRNGNELADRIHDAGFGVTRIEAMGSVGPVLMIYTIVKRKDVDKVLSIIHSYSQDAFITIEEVRSTEKGFFSTEMDNHKILFASKKSK